MTKLRLGPIVDDKPVKLTLEISGELMREIGDYAQVHAKLTERTAGCTKFNDFALTRHQAPNPGAIAEARCMAGFQARLLP